MDVYLFILKGNRIIHIHATKMNHIFVANTRWRYHSTCVLRLDLIYFINACIMDILYSVQYAKVYTFPAEVK